MVMAIEIATSTRKKYKRRISQQIYSIYFCFRVLYDHLRKLANIITPNNKYLLINKVYLNECPWIPAQEALEAMAAYHSARDKVKCVICCTTSIMDLLSLAQDRGSITADDFTPVLVYVIIKVRK